MAIHRLATLTWPEVTALALQPTVAILPTGALEAHGPHLPISTDIIIADAMARSGAERLAARGHEVLLLPCLPVAPAPFAASFSGTVDVPAAAVTAIVVGLVKSLARHGIAFTALANAHHDPAHVRALRDAVDEITRLRAGHLIFPDLTRRRWAERLTDEVKSGACHAGQYEGSIVYAEQPLLVKTELMSQLPPNPVSLVDAVQNGHRTFADAGGTAAYFGFPAEATAEEGRHTVDELGAILEIAVLEAIGGRTSAV
jgi:creatinine amidohydrolase